MPALSPTMDKGNIASWLKKDGDKVATGDALAEIETDKATQEFPWTEDDMFMAKMFHPSGAKDIPVGEPICVLVENAKDVPAFKDFKAASTPATDAAPAPAAAAPPPPPPPPQVQAQPAAAAPPPPSAAPASSEGGRVFASPLARNTAAAAGIALNTLTGTGPNGRIINADVTEAAARPAAAAPQKPAAAKAPAAPTTGSYVDIDVTQIRRVTAERLTLSKSTIPHYYLTVDCRVDKLQQVRKELNDAAKAGEYKLSVNDFVIKAAALAMRRVPSVNASWQGTFIRQYSNVDVSVAVNTDRGLITPIVFNAQGKGLAEISNNMKDLATRAKDNKLQLAEFSGGTFTVSNLGGFGIKQFAAVINPPQAAILAVGGIEERIVPRDAHSDALTRAHFLTVTLSCDHRVVDGAIGANWMTAFKELIEEPNKLLL